MVVGAISGYSATGIVLRQSPPQNAIRMDITNATRGWSMNTCEMDTYGSSCQRMYRTFESCTIATAFTVCVIPAAAPTIVISKNVSGA